MILYICKKCHENISTVSEFLRGCGLYTEFSKEYNPVYSVVGIMVLVLTTLSDSVLLLYQVLLKYPKGF